MVGTHVYIIFGILGIILTWLGRYNEPPRVFRMSKLDDKTTWYKDYDPYRNNVSGLISNNPGGNSGNDLRYTSDYFILGQHFGILQYEKQSFRAVTGSCLVLPGLYRRSPTSDNEGTRIDDIVSIAAAAQLVDQAIAEDILRYGRKNYWFYTDVRVKNRTLANWLGRYPGMIAHLEYCAGECPSMFKRAAWSLSVLWCALKAKNNQDEWVLSQRLIEAYELSECRTFIQDKLCNYWRRRFHKYWPNGMKELLTKYFGHVHPLAKWAIDP